MDQSLDLDIYYELKGSFEASQLSQIRALHTRILKLSLDRPDREYMDIGERLFDSGQFQKSIFPFKRATIMNPSNPKAHILLAKAFLRLEKEDECFLTIKKALSIDPQAGSFHRFFIETLEEKNRLDGLEAFNKEIEDMITDPTEIPFFYFENAEILVSCNKSPQAIMSYKKAVENGSKDYYHYYNYGLALYREGFFEEAIVQFDNVRKLDPSVKLAWNNVAHLHYCLGRVEKAREEFEYIIANGLEAHVTYSNFLLVLHHLNVDEEVMGKYKGLFQPYVVSHHYVLPKLYNEELRITKAILQKEALDEKTKEFNSKKLEGINLILSFFK